MTKRLPYDRYPTEDKPDDFPSPYDEMMSWQDKQIAVFKERTRKRWELFWIVVVVIVAIAVISAAIYGLVRLNHYSQDQYYIGFSTWASNCQGAGGRVAGNYSNASSQTCVFPGGSQLTRTAST